MSSVVDFALPNHEDPPAECTELFVVCFVALPVTSKLWKPILCLGFRNMRLVTAPMLMPKAASNLNYFLTGAKN